MYWESGPPVCAWFLLGAEYTLTERRDFLDHIIISNWSILEVLNLKHPFSSCGFYTWVLVSVKSCCSGSHASPHFFVRHALLDLLPAGVRGQANLDSLSSQLLAILSITSLILKKWLCTDQLCDMMEVTLRLPALVSSLIKNRQYGVLAMR